MRDTLLFSFVIPTYNRGDFIRKTILSLLAQDVNTFEVIVVDDGSTDNTESVVASISDSRVRYFKKENAERAAARNYGLRKASGQYVNFFDSDDLAYPNHLSEAKIAIEALRSPEVFHLGYDVKDIEGNLIRRAENWPGTINNSLIDGNHLSCNGVFLRRDVGLQFPFNEIRALSASEDYELWLRLAARYPIHCRNVVTSTVVNHENRSVIRINRDGLIRRMALLEEQLFQDEGFNRTFGNRKHVFLAFKNIYISLHLAMAGNHKAESLSYLYRALRIYPRIVLTRRFLAALKNLLL